MTREEAERLLVLAREAKLVGPDAASWIERLAPEREELVEAARFLAENGEEEAAAELAANVWRLGLLSGDLAGGLRLLAAALDVGEGRPSRAGARTLRRGAARFPRGRADRVAEEERGGARVARAVGDREAEALALVGLSRLAFREGDYTRVRALAAEARELTRDLGAAAGVAPLHMLAAGTRLAGDYDEAIELYTESLELNRRLGDSRTVGMELHNIGHVELHRGNVDAAGIVLDPDDAFEVDWLHDQLG